MGRYFFFLVLSFLISCNGHRSFYEYSTKEDLYRMPLIEPYELTNIFGSDDYRQEDAYSTWQIFLIHGYYPFTGARAEEVNVTKEIIYGFRPRFDSYPPTWFAIIPKEKIEKIFKDQEKEWRLFLASKGVESIKLYNVWEIFDKFRSDKILPWYNPKEGVFPTNDPSWKK